MSDYNDQDMQTSGARFYIKFLLEHYEQVQYPSVELKNGF